MRAFCLAALVACGCGFRGAGSDADSGAADGAAGDLAGALDFAAPPGGSGPGPLGALPTGFCCAANEQCRSRQCFRIAPGPYYCADDCDTALQCSGFTTQFTCDTGNHSCTPVNRPYTCLDGNGYAYGGKPNGACCDGAAARAGQECLGGLCLRTGAAGSPFYCTQGCDDVTACPAGYTCHLLGPGLAMQGQCWKSDAAACQ